MLSASQILIFILIILNIGAFISVGSDKRNSINGSDRSPEINFFLWSAFFGTLGIFLGMLFFRHKTKKFYFSLGVCLLLAQQTTLLYLLLNN